MVDHGVFGCGDQFRLDPDGSPLKVRQNAFGSLLVAAPRGNFASPPVPVAVLCGVGARFDDDPIGPLGADRQRRCARPSLGILPARVSLSLSNVDFSAGGYRLGCRFSKDASHGQTSRFSFVLAYV
jgi:hypothetical protein